MSEISERHRTVVIDLDADEAARRRDAITARGREQRG
jgi:hypothetical protein